MGMVTILYFYIEMWLVIFYWKQLAVIVCILVTDCDRWLKYERKVASYVLGVIYGSWVFIVKPKIRKSIIKKFKRNKNVFLNKRI